MEKRLGTNAVPIQIPLGAEEKFEGVIDLVEMKAISYELETLGAEFSEIDIPEKYLEQAQQWREKMVEKVAEVDEHLLNKYVSGEEISPEELKNGLRKATCEIAFTLCLCGSAFKNKGVQPLLDAIVNYLPSPLDIPPVEGINLEDEEIVKRESSNEEPFSALIF